MSYLKKRIAVFLCMVMAFTTVFFVTPQEQALAASKVQFSWSFGLYNSTVKEAQIELGAEDLYIGDYIQAYTSGATYKNYGYLSSASGVTYKSSNKNIIAVDSKGKLTAKKTGTATITVKYKGQTGKCKLEVVNSLAAVRAKVEDFENRVKVCKNLVSAYGTGITNENRYKVLKAYKNYLKVNYGPSPIYADISTSYNETSIRIKTNYYIYNTAAGRAKVVNQAINEYKEERNPLSTQQGKHFKIKSITGKGTSVTVTLKSKVTAEQIVGIQFYDAYSDEVSAKKTSTVKFPMYIVDKNNKREQVTATVKKGSNKITIKTPKLKKGAAYQLTGDGWLDPKYNKCSFKAK